MLGFISFDNNSFHAACYLLVYPPPILNGQYNSSILNTFYNSSYFKYFLKSSWLKGCFPSSVLGCLISRSSWSQLRTPGIHGNFAWGGHSPHGATLLFLKIVVWKDSSRCMQPSSCCDGLWVQIKGLPWLALLPDFLCFIGLA